MTSETALVILDDIFKQEEKYKDKPLYIELAETYRNALENEKQIEDKKSNYERRIAELEAEVAAYSRCFRITSCPRDRYNHCVVAMDYEEIVSAATESDITLAIAARLARICMEQKKRNEKVMPILI